jgi:hypothetical protein
MTGALQADKAVVIFHPAYPNPTLVYMSRGAVGDAQAE